MSAGTLTIDLDAVVANWQALSAKSHASVKTGAVVKANAYGLGADQISGALARAGARQFFVATAQEAETLRSKLAPEYDIFVFSGMMAGDQPCFAAPNIIPLLNDPAQVRRFLDASPDGSFGLQLDCGMNRLGAEASQMDEIKTLLAGRQPKLVMSHMSNADDASDPLNQRQLKAFRAMTSDFTCPKSLSATGGVLIGPDFHFDLCRPGIGLYGGAPFDAAHPVVTLSLPVVQIRELSIGGSVGYGADWIAERPSRIATLAAGYADGLLRAISGSGLSVWHKGKACPIVGRVSMDLLTVDVTDLAQEVKTLEILNAQQTVEDFAKAAGTSGYEVLTSLGGRYNRLYIGG